MHLTDCFIDVMAYVTYFQKTVSSKQPSYEQVKADILRLLSQSENCVQKGAFSREDYDQARFMVCAWADETLLNSSWNQKGLWQKEKLQRIYYQTDDAGEEVFEKLNLIGLHQRDVREVYYLCLALGFMGRYCHKGDEYLLEQLKTANLKLLTGSALTPSSLGQTELFPEAYPAHSSEVQPQRRRTALPFLTLVSILGPLILFGILFFVYKLFLNEVGEKFLKAVL
jgi:type VI secretion system protein ImpK